MFAEAAISTAAASADGLMPGRTALSKAEHKGVDVARSDERRESEDASRTKARLDPGGHERHREKYHGAGDC